MSDVATVLIHLRNNFTVISKSNYMEKGHVWQIQLNISEFKVTKIWNGINRLIMLLLS